MVTRPASVVVRRVVIRVTNKVISRHSLARRYLNTDAASPPTVPITAANKVQRIFPPDQKSHWGAPRDILGRAGAGSCKTSAYIIPALESHLSHVEQHAKLAVVNTRLEARDAGCARLAYRRGSAGTLVLAPTRELAIRIANDVQSLTTHHKDVEVQLFVGDNNKAQQKEDWMESSRDLVVATPGRLRDLLANDPEFRQGFKGCSLLILDEADTLLSMGFRDDIDAIVSFLPQSPLRQTLLFTATMPRAVRQLASWILSPNFESINVAPAEPGLLPCRNEEHLVHPKLVSCDNKRTTHDPVEQFHTLCPTAFDQFPTLLKLLVHDQLSHGSDSMVIVFCPTAQMADLFTKLLRSLAGEVLPDKSTGILKMHWKMKRSDRARSRALFRNAGKTSGGQPIILLISDVNGEMMNYPGVTRVIQIGIPSNEAMYVHRTEGMVRGLNSFAPGKTKENNNRAIVRADLLLLPWEAGYMDWQLTGLPIKLLPISDLDSELATLSPDPPILTSQFTTSTLADALRRIDPADVRSTAASLLGYYLPLAPPLRLQPHAILAGVSSWTSECFHVSIPTIRRFPKKFTEAYEQCVQSGKTKGLSVDGLRLANSSFLGKAKFKNRSVWEGVSTRRKKPKRWY